MIDTKQRMLLVAENSEIAVIRFRDRRRVLIEGVHIQSYIQVLSD